VHARGDRLGPVGGPSQGPYELHARLVGLVVEPEAGRPDEALGGVARLGDEVVAAGVVGPELDELLIQTQALGVLEHDRDRVVGVLVDDVGDAEALVALEDGRRVEGVTRELVAGDDAEAELLGGLAPVLGRQPAEGAVVHDEGDLRVRLVVAMYSTRLTICSE
jgi:hypothetical protein